MVSAQCSFCESDAIINVMFYAMRQLLTFVLFLISFFFTPSAVPLNMDQAAQHSNGELRKDIEKMNALSKNDSGYFDSLDSGMEQSTDYLDGEEEEDEVVLDRITRMNNAVMATNQNEVDINELADVTLYEGDIVMNNTQYKHLLPHVNQLTKRSSVRQHSYLWTSKIIPYVIDSKIPPDTIDVIKRALGDYENKTCLTFTARTSELNWIRFTRQQGCWSHIGRQIPGPQNISIGSGCESVGIIQHEVMHALGFFHEQSRPDRDSFITIFWENILPGQENNFVRYADDVINTLGLSYDYESVLHYGNRYFSKNGRPTILATSNAEIAIGQRSGLSKLDYAKVNILYDCSSPVDGHWGPWSRLTPCSSWCGVGIQRRVRMCNDPYPANGGQPCLDESVELRRCRIRLCNKAPYDCDFTDNACNWLQSNSDDFDWTRKSDGTPSINTGPEWDHTGLMPAVEESYGFFLYIEASGKPFGSRAILRSGIIQESGTSDVIHCLSFYYHMFGVGIGELNIYIVLLDGEQMLMWRKSGNQGRKWHHGMVSFLSSSPHQIVFEGVRGEAYTGDIAIDDISILNFRCETKPSPPINMMQSTTKTKPSISIIVPLTTITLSSTPSHTTFAIRSSLTSEILSSVAPPFTTTPCELSHRSLATSEYASSEEIIITSMLNMVLLPSVLASSTPVLPASSSSRTTYEESRVTPNLSKFLPSVVSDCLHLETSFVPTVYDSLVSSKTIQTSGTSLKQEIIPAVTLDSRRVVPIKINLSSLPNRAASKGTHQTSVKSSPTRTDTRKITGDILERQNLSTEGKITNVVLPTSSLRSAMKSSQRIIQSVSKTGEFSGSGQSIDTADESANLAGHGSGCGV